MSTAAEGRDVPWQTLQRGALIVGAVGLAVWALGWVLAVVLGNPQLHLKVFFSYLFAFAFCLAIPLGSMAIWMIHNQTGGAWGLLIHRVLEAGTRTVPFMAILFVPLLFGLGRLYLWADLSELDESVHHLFEVLERKVPYLNVPWFLIRTAGYFAAWILVALMLNHEAAALERNPDPPRARRLQVLSGLGFVAYGLGMTFAAIDWLMSLEPDWFSTIYGILVIAGQFVPGLAFAVAATAWLSSYRPLADEEIDPAVWNDLGNLMLASVMFWAYISISQWLLIWSGNLTEEIPWYLRRSQGGWQVIAWLLGVCYFALPFLALLSRRLKRDRRALIVIGLGLILLSVVHYFWLVNPVYAARAGGHYEAYGSLSLHWLDVAALAGVGGMTSAIFLWQLRARPLLPAPSRLPPEPEVARHA
jgi:hypothetical protein